MRYVYFAKFYLSIILIISPMYVSAQCNDCYKESPVCVSDQCNECYKESPVCVSDQCNECYKEPEINLPTAPTCDTYITNSRSNKTLESIDEKITRQVKDLLAQESGLPSITVTTANGVVILSGSASNQNQIDKAADLAASVPCVTEVDTSKFYVQ